MQFIYSLFETKVAYADFNSFLGNVETKIINPVILFLFALALVYFLYGVFEFMMNQSSDENKTAGKSHMLWGVVGITIMLGVWGILNVILSTLHIPSSQIKIESNPSGGYNSGSVKVNLPTQQ